MRVRRIGSCLVTAAPLAAFLAVLALPGCGGQVPAGARLKGDWDYYRMLGAEPNGGFEARRRFGFAHFDGATADGAWIKRRSGETLESIAGVTLTGDSVVLSLGDDRAIRGTISGDTITGRIYRGDTPVDRVWLERRATPPVWEPNYALWPGPVSEPTYQVTTRPCR
jgi:hypothetical protein